MKNGKDSQKPSLQQFGSLAGFITEFLTSILSLSVVQYWLGHKTELKKKLREVFSIVDEYADIRDDWHNFYKSFLGWDVDCSRAIIPAKPDIGRFRLLGIAKGLTLNKVYNTWSFPKNKTYDDLDGMTTINTRTASETYFVWVLDSEKPDQEFLGKSTNEADPDLKIGVTLLERMVFESKYFSETGKHLDIKSITFCSGSRFSGGRVPYVYLYFDKVYVDWYGLDYCFPAFGVRRAVYS